MRKNRIILTCLHCNNPFEARPSESDKKFCSNECYRTNQRENHTVQKTCVICGTVFTQQATRAKEQVTCRSEKCRETMLREYLPAQKRNRITFTCLQCGKVGETTPCHEEDKKFCSEECMWTYKRSHQVRVQKICVICSKPFTQQPERAKEQVTCRSIECKAAIKSGEHSPFYGRNHSEESKAKISKAKTLPRVEVNCTCGCGEMVELAPWKIRNNKTNVFFVDQSHMRKWLVGENHWNYRGGNVYYGDGWARIARAVRERDKVCQHCGKTSEENGRALDVHHINPVRVSQDNSMENLIALCMSCHHKINVFEQYDHPHKVSKYRKCRVCDRLFIPEPFQKICSSECRRKRERQYEKKYRDTHPEYVSRRQQRIKEWQEANPARMTEYSLRRTQKKRLKRQMQQRPGLFDHLDW